jgi:hypothetical protein
VPLGLSFALNSAIRSGLFQNGTHHIFFQFTGIKYVFQMFGDGGALHTEEIGNTV